MSRAVLSIGSNVGDRAAHLRTAVAEFLDVLVAASPVYQTPAWGGVPQEPYLNAILLVEGGHTPVEWLARAHHGEAAGGRERAVRWGPRTLDVDIVHIDGIVSSAPDLRLPHPLAHERAFVLLPWLDVDPAAELSGRPIREWLSTVDSAGIHRCSDVDIRP
ncbi:MAG: 2-amino-4-hydroxy-6-hydroxymethyldihydropteridine diphosphokinase [Actinomycetota bacterium]|nr:2-amino-4-hydroxy-6-hydroxymethyldihydropteridine diphosphokinase [Actinomycetota bacterium]